MDKVIAHCEKHFQDYVEDLKTLVKIPSVGFEGFPKEEMQRSGQAVAALLKKRGLENVQILEMPGVHPYIYGEWLKAPGKPTILLYAHHDVQPVGNEGLWKTAPYEPSVRPGPGGERLYGRGTADDKAGIVMHTASISAYLESVGKLPLNVKVLIEGEEEIGSPNLETFLKKHGKLLSADVLVLADAGNFDCGVPASTVTLRGLVAADIEVRVMNGSVHSGSWGGPVPDPAMALAKMLAGCVDEKGFIAIPGVREQVRPLSPQEKAEYDRIPFNEEDFRKQAGMVAGTQILAEGPNPLVQTWRYPSLTVNAIQASSRKTPANIINDAAWAKVSIRLVPDMDPEKVLKQFESFLRSRVPWGLELTFKVDAAGEPWAADVSHPAYQALDVAMKKGYGVAPLKIGCGGSIGFVKPFVEALNGAPALLVGVEDPYTAAHGENESLLISDFKKGCLSQIHLFAELAERWQKK